MEYKLQEYGKKKYKEYILGADIGGTNTNLGVFGIGKIPEMIFYMQFKSRQLKSIKDAVSVCLKECKKRKINISSACIAGAGVIDKSRKNCRLVNVKWNIRCSDIKIKRVMLINDFEAQGYGLNLLNKKDVLALKMRFKKGGRVAIVGAGTGLGKCTVVYNKGLGYIPYSSEGGHADFPVQNKEEIDLARYILKKTGQKGPLVYEQVISGPGIANIYEFISKGKKRTPEETICGKDPVSKKAIRLFLKFYGRCAKNFVLDTLSTGGIFLSGGIAAKNPGIFKDKVFLDELHNVYKERFLIKRVPVMLIKDYKLGMKGAAYAIFLNIKGKY